MKKLQTCAWFLMLFCLFWVSLPFFLDIAVAFFFTSCTGHENPWKGPLGYVWVGHMAMWLTLFGAAPPF